MTERGWDVVPIKVCHTLNSQSQGKGHNLGSEFKIPLSNYSEKYQSKLHLTSQKDEAS